MQTEAAHAETSPAIQTDLAAIFISLELSRSIWLITSLSPGSGEKMSKHSVRAGDVAGLLARFSGLKEKAFARTRKSFPIMVIQEAGLDGFWLHRALEQEGVDTLSIRPRLRRRAGGGGPRPTGSTARRCFARCWRISAANRGCV